MLFSFSFFVRCFSSGVGAHSVPVHALSQPFILALLLGGLMSQPQAFSSSSPSIASLESSVTALMRDAKTEADEIRLFRQLFDRGLLQAALQAALRDPEVRVLLVFRRRVYSEENLFPNLRPSLLSAFPRLLSASLLAPTMRAAS
jgi:hypothetical protein